MANRISNQIEITRFPRIIAKLNQAITSGTAVTTLNLDRQVGQGFRDRLTEARSLELYDPTSGNVENFAVNTQPNSTSNSITVDEVITSSAFSTSSLLFLANEFTHQTQWDKVAGVNLRIADTDDDSDVAFFIPKHGSHRFSFVTNPNQENVFDATDYIEGVTLSFSHNASQGNVKVIVDGIERTDITKAEQVLNVISEILSI